MIDSALVCAATGRRLSSARSHSSRSGGLEAVELLEGGLDQAVGLAEEAKQQVLGVELVVAEAQQELLDTGQSLACFISESFERDQEGPPRRPPRLLLRPTLIAGL